MKLKLFFMSVIILGLIVNISYSTDFAFGDKPDKEDKQSKKIEAKATAESKKIEAKATAESKKIEAKATAESKKIEAKAQKMEAKAERKEVKEFGNGSVVYSSSTTTICHIPPGNPANNRTLIVGTSSLSGHLGHGDVAMPCDEVDWDEWNNNGLENETDENNDDLVEQISQQIADLQKRLQQLFGL